MGVGGHDGRHTTRTGLKVSPACSSFLCLLSASSQTLGPKPQVTNKGPYPLRIVHLVCHTTIHRPKATHNLTDRDKSTVGALLGVCARDKQCQPTGLVSSLQGSASWATSTL